MSQIDTINISTELLQLLTPEQAWHYLIVPRDASGSEITFYVDNQQPLEALTDELEILLDKDIKLEPLPPEEINKILGKFYRKVKRSQNNAKQVDGDVSSDDFITSLILEASSLGSSDIHFEPYEDKCRVRIRMDGKLVERYILGKDGYPAMVNKIKINANLDIAEKRLPQDGRIQFHEGPKKFDIRVSILPTLFGEKIVLRLLSQDATEIDINHLGFKPGQLHDYSEQILKSYGIILISGPTGSGKTTTLYATLKILNQKTSNIMTIEDPIEYTLEGINQVQLKESIGLTFSEALRTFLRQDPDIIMLGEIRDGKTAQMAIRAALTGHLVLSTIHTNSAWGIITRLIDMGVPSFLVASTLNLAVAQRLVRLLCPSCKKSESFDPELLPGNFEVKDLPMTHFKAVGCEECYYTGYKGRKAVYEVIAMDKHLANKIKNSQYNVSSYLDEKGVQSLGKNAFELFKQGDTSIEEIYSILINQESD